MSIKKMEDLIFEMARIYKERHQQKELDFNVWRGTSKNCSAEFEDLIGKLVGEILGEDYVILVSYNISVYLPEAYWVKTKKIKKDGNPVIKKNESREPDVLIYHKDTKEIIGILDLKNDVGYTSFDWVKQAINTIQLLKIGREITYNPKDQEEKIILNCPKEFYYGFVILNLQNNHDKFPEYEKQMKRANFPFYILNQYVHLNDFEKVTNDTICATGNRDYWGKLVNDIEFLKVNKI